MADIIRHPYCNPGTRPELTREYMARDMRNWRLRRALEHLEEAVKISRDLGDSAKQVRYLELAVRMVRRFCRPRALNLFAPRQLDLFEETG